MQVKMRDQFGNYNRVVFDGNEDDARAHLVANFPRLHVEPGSTAEPEPDAVLSNGAHWDGVKWHNDSADSESADDESANESADTQATAPRRAAPRKAS